jgi:catechol 2,3-dioxygenase-like lactoylglutathione lyase family enzyme
MPDCTWQTQDMATPIQITFDCADPATLSAFWAAALGYKLQDPPESYASWQEWLAEQGIPETEWNSASAIVDPNGKGPRMYFQRVPEGKTAKNRVHLDVNVGGGPGTPVGERREHVASEVARIVELGGTKVSVYDERGEHWVVMQDPEGNEFCLQ